MKIETVSKTSDFIIRIIMIIMTAFLLIYFAGIQNQFLFSTLALIFLLAIVVKGITQVMMAGRKSSG